MSNLVFEGILTPIVTLLAENNNIKYLFNGHVLNDYINKNLTIELKGTRICKNCKVGIKAQSEYYFCYKCFISLPYCDTCMIFPHKCHFHLGTCRDQTWGIKNCFTSHYLYLAFTSSFKIGVTSLTRVPNRWMKQGALSCTPVFLTPNRRIAGMIEHYLKDFFNDKTQWQSMLKVPNDHVIPSLAIEVQKILKVSHEFLKDYPEVKVCQTDIIRFRYPLDHIEKVKTLNVQKVGHIHGKILGFKGNYVVLDTGIFNWDKIVWCRGILAIS